MLCTLTYLLVDITKGTEVAEVLVDSTSTSVLLNQNLFHSKQLQLYAANWGAAPQKRYCSSPSWIQFCTQVKMFFQNQENDAEFCKASKRVTPDTEIHRTADINDPV